MKVVTICGSLKFQEEMMKVAADLQMKKGWCVIQCIYNLGNVTEEEHKLLDKIHRKKIDLSDAIYVVNVGGYIGESCRGEIEYAKSHGKEVIFHEQ